MTRSILRQFILLLMALSSLGIGLLLSTMTVPGDAADREQAPDENVVAAGHQAESTETLPPTTLLVTTTERPTLKPPPTFEPPTPTIEPSPLPTQTAIPTIGYEVTLPPLIGLESPTPSSTPGCEPRENWQLVYQVQFGDALASIAEKYGTNMYDLAAGNCLEDMNLIVEGQHLRVPGEVHPDENAVECFPLEVLTPWNGTEDVPAAGQLTFNWRGPRTTRNLIRIFKPDGTMEEIVVELRQNETVNLTELFPEGGTYTWYVYPLNQSYVQVCPEGGPWKFTKEAH